jgi:methyl-accepting chemotaxis protein
VATKVATAIASGSATETAEALARDIREKLGGASPALLTLFPSTAQPLGEIAARIAAAFPEATVLGASTAGEFTERGDAKGAAVLVAVAGDYRVHAGMGTGLKASPERAIERALEGLPRAVNGYPHRTAILLLDPLAGNGEEATLIAASILGEGVRLAGGAAGDDLKMSTTFVSLGGRAESDAVVLAMLFSKKPLGVGVCHGHQPISEPLKVTRAEGNVVHELDGKPAWPVWLAHTKERAAAASIDVGALSKEAEGPFLLRYEAGLAAGRADYKIRAPLTRNADDSISFACGIAEGSVIRITESIPERQIESAREAARRAAAQLDGKAAGAIVFDCICRNLILADGFSRGVRGISEVLGDVPLGGFETYGEIALDAGDMSGFHNTTSVVLAFPEG